jgi:AcrR family transcriptional regulator
LNRDQILDVAERIAATEGTAKLTLRRLGDELGVNHTALYRHYRDKAALLEALADRVLERRLAPPPGTDRRETLRQQLRHAIARYDIHPDMAQLIALRPGSTEVLAATAERALEQYEADGLSVDDAAMLFQLTEMLVVGLGLYMSLVKWGVHEGRTLDAAAERRALALLSPDNYPRLVEAAPHMFQDPEAIADRAVDVLLNGIDQLIAEHAGDA